MKFRQNLKNFIRNPRVELIPSILNLPIVAVILILFFVEPDFVPVINFEGASLFGFDFNYAILFIIICVTLAVYILLLIALDLKFREKIPIALFILPIISILLLSILLSSILYTHDIFSVYYLYKLMGRDIGLILFIVCIISALTFGFIMIFSIPRLWKYQLKTLEQPENEGTSLESSRRKTRFHPHSLSIITVIGFIIGILYIIILIIGYPSMVFWAIITYGFDWFEPMVIIHIVFLVSFVFIFILRSRTRFLASRLKYTESQIKKILSILLSLALIAQLLIILIFGFTIGIFYYLLNPLSLLSLAELLCYILKIFIIKDGKTKTKIAKKKKYKFLNHKDFKRFCRISFVLIPMVFTIFFIPLLILPPRPEIPETDLNVVKNTYDTLTTSQKTIFDGYMNEKMPNGSNAKDNIDSDSSTRNWIRIASGLLFRNNDGDVENASYIIKKVLEGQKVDESDSNYGRYTGRLLGDNKGHLEFVACEIIIILEYHKSKLSNSLVSDMKESIFYAADACYEENIRPSYTNIALMSAFLMEYVGDNLDHPYLENAGIMKSWEIYLLFTQYNTFSEYNSPTYNGVDMIALAMWRDLGPSEEMRRMGAYMESKLWKEVSKLYHPGFKNIVGPFFRSYDMDMNTSYPIIGMWIGLALDDLSMAPLRSDENYTNMEMSNIFPTVQLGHSVPSDSILKRFKTFSDPRYIERKVPSKIGPFSKVYTVTAVLSDDWMMGGVAGKVKADGQFKVGTLYWISSVNESLAWLLVSGLNYLDVEVSETSMTISQIGRTNKIIFYINSQGLDVDMIDDSIWNLPGIDLEIDGRASKITAELVDDTDQFRKDFNTGSVDTVVKVECKMDSITIKPQ